jgi:hypothetical protein
MSKPIDPTLEKLVRLGFLTRARAEQVDDLAGSLATDIIEGRISREQANTIAVALGDQDGQEERARRRGEPAKGAS